MPGPDAGFNVTERDGLRLISPRKDKYDWSEDERFYRSVVVDGDGRPVSVGLPKFFNAGEHPGDTAALEAALAGGKVWFTEKMDGSLIIRSVVNGDVILRTRGTLDGGTDHGPAVRRLAAERYPQLLDPTLEPDRSLLFEFVSPQFPIIVAYPEPDLVLLGANHNLPGSLLDRPEIEALGADIHVPVAPGHDLPTDLDELLAAVRDWPDREGIVAICDGGQTLVKIKGAKYLAAHALRFAFTPRRVAEFAIEKNLRNEADFVAALRGEGYDWEVADQTKRSFELIRAAWADADQQLEQAQAFVAENRHLSRKDFAAKAVPQGAIRSTLFSLLDGRDERAAADLRDRLVADAVREANTRGLLLTEE